MPRPALIALLLCPSAAPQKLAELVAALRLPSRHGRPVIEVSSNAYDCYLQRQICDYERHEYVRRLKVECLVPTLRPLGGKELVGIV